jgi:hypothetical protein
METHGGLDPLELRLVETLAGARVPLLVRERVPVQIHGRAGVAPAHQVLLDDADADSDAGARADAVAGEDAYVDTGRKRHGTHTHARTHARTHACTHARMHARMHARARKHTGTGRHGQETVGHGGGRLRCGEGLGFRV